MTGVLAVIAAGSALSATQTLDPQHLPQLPARGLVHMTPTGVELETLRGRPIGLLRGLRLSQVLGAHGGLLQTRDGSRRFLIDRAARRLRRVYPVKLPAPKGCTFTDAGKRTRLYVCGLLLKAVSGTRVRIVARGPGKIGHWAWADLSADERSILGQWSAECEVPQAFLIAGGKTKRFGASSTTESLALGWLGDRAVIHYPMGVCGSAAGVPGIYAVPRVGKPRLLRAVRERASAWAFGMWG